MAVTATAVSLSQDARRRLATVLDELRATYGSRWRRVPFGFGERAAGVREAWVDGLVPVDVDQADPVRVIQELGAFARTTSVMAVDVRTEARILGEPFGADLTTLPLARLRQLCRAIVRLSVAPRATTAWASPAEAHAASIVLAALGEDLRALADVRRELYDEYTEEVWQVEGRGVRARRQLAAATRSGHAPTDAKRALTLVRRGQELSAGIDAASTAVSSRLGELATAGIPDVDGAAEALSATRELHEALGEALDVERLRALITADAFVADELVLPAKSILTHIDAWEARARAVDAVEPLAKSAEDLWLWAVDTENALRVLSELKSATSPLRVSTRTVGQILDDAVRRDLARLIDASGPA